MLIQVKEDALCPTSPRISGFLFVGLEYPEGVQREERDRGMGMRDNDDAGVPLSLSGTLNSGNEDSGHVLGRMMLKYCKVRLEKT